MRLIRNMVTVARQKQPDNPLDGYLALLHAEDTRRHQRQREAGRTLVRPAYKVCGGAVGNLRSQFELIAQLSSELMEAEPTLSETCIQTSSVSDARSGGVCIPDLIRETRCGGDRPSLQLEAPVILTTNRVTNVPPRKQSRHGGREPLQGPAGKNLAIPTPTEISRASIGLHDQIEAWVNEGGAGDDVV